MDDIYFSIIPLRLTASGHDFASDLSKPGVIEKLVTAFKDAGPRESAKIVSVLAVKSIQKRIDKILEDD